MERTFASLLILGIGNTLRSDDGIGAYVCGCLSRMPLKNTEIDVVHQLHTEWLDALSGFGTVILVDAKTQGEDSVGFVPLPPNAYPESGTTHYLPAGIIAGLLSGVFPIAPLIYVCSVPGYDFSIGEGLSPRGRMRADEAVDLLRKWLTENGYLSGSGHE